MRPTAEKSRPVLNPPDTTRTQGILPHRTRPSPRTETGSEPNVEEAKNDRIAKKSTPPNNLFNDYKRIQVRKRRVLRSVGLSGRKNIKCTDKDREWVARTNGRRLPRRPSRFQHQLNEPYAAGRKIDL